MTIEKVLEFAFGLVKKEPKVVLPNVLNWIPSALLSILLLQGAMAFSEWFDLETISEFITDSAFFWKVFNKILPYVLIAIPILVAEAVIHLILACLYSDITRQAYSRRKILLTRAFSVAKMRFLPLLWTYFVQFLIIILIFAGVLGFISLGIVMGKVWALLGILIGGSVGVISVLLVLVFFYETPAVVVIENKSGMDAIKRSYTIGRRNFWSLFFVILLVGIIVGFINSGLSNVPHVGFILANIAGLFLNTWRSSIPAVFYYEYEKRKRPLT